MNIIASGDVYVGQGLGVIQTTLGSCVAVCARDPIAKVVGMNHFALPDSSDAVSKSKRYGVHAMEVLLNELYKIGAEKNRLELFYAGGAMISEMPGRVGWLNIGFVEEFCCIENLKVVGRCVGGNRGRKLLYFGATGRGVSSFLTSYLDENPVGKTGGSMELF